MKRKLINIATVAGGGLAFAFSASMAFAYTGTNCEKPGMCWEPKAGYPERVAGTKYDPKHDPNELAKQQESIQGMEERNRLRVEHFKKTGEFIFDVDKIPKS